MLIVPLVACAAPLALTQDDGLQRRISPVVEAVQQARPAVVHIQTNQPSRQPRGFWYRSSPETSAGSGVVLFEDGYIMTNNHVVEDAKEIIVRFDPADDPEVYQAELISRVPQEDLALIKIDGGPFPTIPLGSNDPLLGETVIAIGNPYGQTHTVSSGIISGLHRNIRASGLDFTNLIQTDASINPGNSGGPLLNINGELIGINTAWNREAENIGFAIPVARIQQVLNDHLLSISKSRAYLGFDLRPEDLTVDAVTPGSPAASADLRPGDKLVRFGDKELEDEEDYRLARLSVQPQAEVTLRVERNGSPRTVQLSAWNRSSGLLFERVGLTVEQARYGRQYASFLRVRTVRPDSPAAELTLQAGDVIMAFQAPGRRAIRPRNIYELVFLVNSLAPGTTVELEIFRDDDQDGRLERDPEYSELYRGSLDLL